MRKTNLEIHLNQLKYLIKNINSFDIHMFFALEKLFKLRLEDRERKQIHFFKINRYSCVCLL